MLKEEFRLMKMDVLINAQRARLETSTYINTNVNFYRNGVPRDAEKCWEDMYHL